MISYVSIALLNTRPTSKVSRLEVSDLSAQQETVVNALRSLEPPAGESPTHDQRPPPEPGRVKPAAAIALAEGVQRMFVPKPDDGTRAAMLREALASTELTAADRQRAEDELDFLTPDPDEPYRYRFRTGALPFQFLGRVSEEDVAYLVSPRPRESRSSGWDPRAPDAARHVSLQAFFPPQDWELDLAPFEMRQVLLRVEHTDPCLLEVAHVVCLEDGGSELTDRFQILVNAPT